MWNNCHLDGPILMPSVGEIDESAGPVSTVFRSHDGDEEIFKLKSKIVTGHQDIAKIEIGIALTAVSSSDINSTTAIDIDITDATFSRDVVDDIGKTEVVREIIGSINALTLDTMALHDVVNRDLLHTSREKSEVSEIVYPVIHNDDIKELLHPTMKVVRTMNDTVDDVTFVSSEMHSIPEINLSTGMYFLNIIVLCIYIQLYNIYIR